MRVFMSYSRSDASAAATVAEDISRLGHTAWYDREVAGGQAWWSAILGQIRQCDLFVVILTPHLLESQACRAEFNYASRLQKAILPILCHEDVKVNVLPPELSRIQFVDYRIQGKHAAFALANALLRPPETVPLPDPLPSEPPVPISYLGDLRAQIESDQVVDLAGQRALLFEVKSRLKDPESGEDALELLRLLRNRPDLLAIVAEEIDEVLDRKSQQRKMQQDAVLDKNRAVPVSPETRTQGKNLGPSRGAGAEFLKRSGEDDIEKSIVDWMVDEFRSGQDIDLSKDSIALSRLEKAAERAKVELSTVFETEINLPFITADASGPKHLRLRLTRARYQQMCEDILKKIGTAPPVSTIKLSDDNQKLEELVNRVATTGNSWTLKPLLQSDLPGTQKIGEDSLSICVERDQLILAATFGRWIGDKDVKRLQAIGWVQESPAMPPIKRLGLVYASGGLLLLHKGARDYLKTIQMRMSPDTPPRGNERRSFERRRSITLTRQSDPLGERQDRLVQPEEPPKLALFKPQRRNLIHQFGSSLRFLVV